MADYRIEELSEMQKCLMTAMKGEIAKGVDCLNADEAGKVIDMIKDLSEAIYYQTVTSAMDDEQTPKYGYNNRRYSNGEYAPAGRGRMGYNPVVEQMPYIDGYLRDPSFSEKMKMGYDHYPDMRYGEAYRSYMNSKRHYTATNSHTDKEEMEAHANQHVADTIATIREIWKSADPEMKKQIKADFTKLLGDMTV